MRKATKTSKPSPRKSAKKVATPKEEFVLKPRIRVHARNESQESYLDSIEHNDLTFGLGPAGTGKSFLAVAKAVEALSENQVKKIILIRPSVEAGEKLGFLPGSLTDKVAPFLTPLFDSLEELLSPREVEFLLKSGQVEVATLAYMRGRTLKNAFIILDEAQNSTCDQLFMCVTRLGSGSKLVVNGDLSQVDLPRGMKSGLQFAVEAFQDVPGVGFGTFSSADIVRHALVTRLVKAHENWKAAQS